MVAPCQWFTHQLVLTLKFLTAYVHRSTLPQSRIRSTAPSEREPGMAGAIQPGTCETVGVRAIFIAPTKGGFHSSECTPSEREPGNVPIQPGARWNPGVRAIFIAPTKVGNLAWGWSKKGASGNVEFPEAPDLRLVRTECPQRLHNPVSRRCTCPASQSSCPR